MHDATAPLALELLEIAGSQPFDLLQLAFSSIRFGRVVGCFSVPWASQAMRMPGIWQTLTKFSREGRGGWEGGKGKHSQEEGTARISWHRATMAFRPP